VRHCQVFGRQTVNDIVDQASETSDNNKLIWQLRNINDIS
jgi:hypothetical protein